MLITVLLALAPNLSIPQDGVSWEVKFLGGVHQRGDGPRPTGGCSGGSGGGRPGRPGGTNPSPYAPGDTTPGSTPSSPTSPAPASGPCP